MMDIGYIARCWRWLLNSLVDDYINHELTPLMQDKTSKMYAAIAPLIDWYDMSKDEATALGFMLCQDSDSPYQLWLIPRWLYPLIPEGLTVRKMNGETFKFSRTTSTVEPFFSCLPYGIEIN